MAQVKFLKIGSDGFTAEHDTSADDLTINSLIINKTTGFNNNEALPKSVIDSLIQGTDWTDSVIDKDLATPPVSPSSGDRYIIATSGTGDWAGQDGNIAEYNGASWDFITPTEGTATYVEDEDVVYIYNGSAWVKMGSIFNHNNLSSLQGGNGSDEYYHMTAAEDTWLANVVADITATNVADLSDDESVTGAWDFATGQLRLPSSANGSPSEGDVYWDGTEDKLYIYDGTAYTAASGDSETLFQVFTAGAGGITAGDVVYISANDTILPANATSLSTAKAIGIAAANISAGNSGQILMSGSIAEGVLTGATAGNVYWLDTNAGAITNTAPTGSGNVILKIGYAVNATDLLIGIEAIRIRG